MPFLNVTGVTNTHSTFNIPFGVINKEDEPAYTWALKRLEDLRTKIGADRPYVRGHGFREGTQECVEQRLGGRSATDLSLAYQQECHFEVKKRWV